MLNISELKMNIIAIGFQLLLIAAAVTTLPTDHVEVTRKEIVRSSLFERLLFLINYL